MTCLYRSATVLAMPDDRDTYSEADYLAVGDAAALLNVSVATVRRWEKRGAIQAVRTPGNQRRFRRADVEALLIPQDAAS